MLFRLNIVIIVKKLANLNVVFFFNDRHNSFKRRSVPHIFIFNFLFEIGTQSTLEVNLLKILNVGNWLGNNMAIGTNLGGLNFACIIIALILTNIF